ncbi:hypothetical protein DK419_13235 [Methylobacterium terrae]|uniref:Uncharacterized protein n=1 Tax=Methylobacterium terrae TaxID=2202827 RepID=A0A2U8WNW9_9HYPH|nr:PC4/YdbC family ssDNA-binding protein [Methylobacterium terrae]AWN47160.1 hypothetical protein DK419_13235 [Methylobacterium terrae]
MEETRIATIPKNQREQIAVRLADMHGRVMADVRVFATNRDGDVVPTAKGVAIRPDLLPAVIVALQQAQALAVERGLIEGGADDGPDRAG